MEPNLHQTFDPGQKLSINLPDDEQQTENIRNQPMSENEYLIPDEDLEDVYFDETKAHPYIKTSRWNLI